MQHPLPRQKQASNGKKSDLKPCKMHVKNTSKNGHFKVVYGSKTACSAPVANRLRTSFLSVPICAHPWFKNLGFKGILT